MSRLLLAVFSAVVLGGCALVRPGTLDEVGELLTEGSEEVLRDSLRVPRGEPRVLVIAIDGIRDDVFRERVASGEMPTLARLLGPARGDGLWAHAAASPEAVAVFPSETAAAWTAVFTGRPPAETGVVGNEWFDRDSLRIYAPVPLSIETFEQTLAVYTDDFLGEQIQTSTLYERADVRAYVAQAFVYRGADVLTRPDLNDIGELLEGAAQAIFGGGEEAFEELDDDAAEGVEGSLDRHGLPDLQVVYFGGPDLAAHGAGPLAQADYLRDETDPDIGRVLDAFAARGALRDLWVVITSDHGHTETLPEDSQSLGDPARSLLRETGRAVLEPTLRPDSTGFDAVMTVNEAAAFVYLADRASCDSVCDWTRPPDLERDVLPVARAFRAAADADTTALSPEARPLAGALDLVLARVSRRGESVPFQVLDGDRLVPLATYLAATPRPDLVDLERRLGWLTDGPMGHRAGDVLLLAKAGEQRPLAERYTFGDGGASGHGSASRSDSIIPLVVANPSASGEAIRQRLREAVGERPTQLDVTDLILDLLEVE
ncbi:MAG: alkaline phosphatase family protein [Bacteroidota bacterium]